MEFNLKKRSIGSLTTALDNVSEQPVDIDFILPDYCPDIEKILRCKMVPKIYNCNLSGGQLQIDGTTIVTVLYVDGQHKNIRACEQSVPFNSVFSVKDIPESYIVEATAKPEYVNCRALSPRRLAIHGAFSLYGKVMCKSTIDLFSPSEDCNLQCKTKDLPCSSLVALCQEQFSAGDEISINNKPPIEVVLNSDVKATITDFKSIPNKLMLNGELSVKLLYLSNVETGEPQQIDCVIPYSHIIDCENITDNITVIPTVDVLSYDVRLKSDMLSESPIVAVDAKLCITARGYELTNVPVVTDAYSTEYITVIQQARTTVMSEIATLKDSFIQKSEVPLEGTDISSICDISNDYTLLSPVITPEGIVLNSKMNVCILAYDSEKNPVYLERSVEFSKTIETEKPFNNIEKVNSALSSLSYRINDNNALELRCEIRYSIALTNSETCNNITSVVSDDDKKIVKNNCALTLYFAEQGESLWDIAKEYSTSKQRLIEENSLEDEVLDSSKMLLIPTV
jgi:hypothetical protein